MNIKDTAAKPPGKQGFGYSRMQGPGTIAATLIFSANTALRIWQGIGNRKSHKEKWEEIKLGNSKIAGFFLSNTNSFNNSIRFIFCKLLIPSPKSAIVYDT